MGIRNVGEKHTQPTHSTVRTISSYLPMVIIYKYWENNGATTPAPAPYFKKKRGAIREAPISQKSFKFKSRRSNPGGKKPDPF